MTNILVTGADGFIGSHLSRHLSKKGYRVHGIDSISDYYEKKLKLDRLKWVKNKNFRFTQLNLLDKKNLEIFFSENKFDLIIHLAAQPGVLYSLENPFAYIENNIIAYLNILELSKKYEVKNLIYASSSSVYGKGNKLPFSESAKTDTPLTVYSATKITDEYISYVYSNLYSMNFVGLRFFTVYGPWGRPDMAPMLFANAILHNEPIQVFNYGEMERDFTFIDDIVEAIFKCCFKPATPNNKFDYLNPDPSSSFAPYRLFNIGNSRPIKLLKFIEILEKEIGIKAVKNFKPMVKGDVKSTKAECLRLSDWIQFTPKTSIDRGVEYFIKWYRDYYSI